MEIIDAQIHVWEDDHPGRPWRPAFKQTRSAFLDDGQSMTGDRAIAAMDAVGIDAAVITAFMLYDDIDYAVQEAARFPDRFRVVPQIDLSHPHPEQLVERYCAQADLLAIRLSFLTENGAEHYRLLAEGGFEPVFAAAAAHDKPAMLVMSGNVPPAAPVLAAHPELTFVIDHLGIVQGPHRVPPAEPFERLDDLLRLAEHDNLAVKFSGVPTLSKEPYPFADLWPHIRRVVDAFGPERMMWGSDFSRTRPMHSYSEAVDYVRYATELTEDEKRLILGQSLRRILRWPAGK